MTCPEVFPHFNKLVKIRLKNKKRKTGWLVFNTQREVPENPFEEVICLDVPAGRRLMAGNSRAGEEDVRGDRFHIAEIDDIRSCL